MLKMSSYTKEIVQEESRKDPDKEYIAWLKKKRRQDE